jgi:hypothetical protein
MLTNILSFTFLIIRILIIANRGGYWVYPILSTLSPFYRAFFMVSSCFLVVLTYKMGHFVNHTTWKLKTKLFFLNHANTSNNWEWFWLYLRGNLLLFSDLIVTIIHKDNASPKVLKKNTVIHIFSFRMALLSF